jgi:hypothetical protein
MKSHGERVKFTPKLARKKENSSDYELLEIIIIDEIMLHKENAS